MKWLIANHAEWQTKNIDFSVVKAKLQRPVLVDNSTEDESKENNVETTESFKVFFPDGSMSTLNGGQANLEAFQKLVQQAKEIGANVDFMCDLGKEAAADFKDNNLVNACLLQFPFGKGGMHELRKRGDGSLTTKMPIEDYVEHLSRVSLPHFHHELFTLILYNISMKQAMVRTAGWKVREKGSAAMFAHELTTHDVNEAINRKQSGHVSAGQGTGAQFLSAVDAVARAVPHTNEAAKKAKQKGEAHQHEFGLANYFLTATPDDENSFLVQMFANKIIDNDSPVSLLSDDELLERAQLRTELRIKHPGICAYFYELMLQIILEEVVGWDFEKRRSRPEGGLLGIVKAFTASTEEQGRSTLHTHYLVWVEGIGELEEKLFSKNSRERRSAENCLVQVVDTVSSCKLYNSDNCPKTEKSVQAFPHNCKQVF